jgi:hypothetical protein
VREGTGEHHKRPDKQEHQTAARDDFVRGNGVRVKSDGIVPAEVGHHGHQGVPEDLNHEVTQHQDW